MTAVERAAAAALAEPEDLSEYRRLMAAVDGGSLGPADKTTILALIFEVGVAVSTARALASTGDASDVDPRGVWTRVASSWCHATGEPGWDDVDPSRSLR